MVTREVPAYTTVVGIPAKPVRRRDAVPHDFRHQDIDDPTARAFECVWLRLRQQEAALAAMQARLVEQQGDDGRTEESAAEPPPPGPELQGPQEALLSRLPKAKP